VWPALLGRLGVVQAGKGAVIFAVTMAGLVEIKACPKATVAFLGMQWKKLFSGLACYARFRPVFF
jgi:hypothetical protein